MARNVASRECIEQMQPPYWPSADQRSPSDTTIDEKARRTQLEKGRIEFDRLLRLLYNYYLAFFASFFSYVCARVRVCMYVCVCLCVYMCVILIRAYLGLRATFFQRLAVNIPFRQKYIRFFFRLTMKEER